MIRELPCGCQVEIVSLQDDTIVYMPHRTCCEYDGKGHIPAQLWDQFPQYNVRETT